ncbi:ribosomal protection-like ABC-F family protein [Ktedonobacter racemifer]|uniref:ABC transporter related protein n=1 Tax=Ktedonobacter racemifer DSM 44963 TaxID=485913 RepID=D6TIR1_KTERA|nr:ABC-F family ATP-binding cassette domain-containing protein [Ktedonobacter racemifer]EFH89318.1 ABC transporter related protein [Ktedonobacter racemifer DSM 44963]
MLLTIRNLTKTYGAITVLSEISCVVNAGDRVGIVGANGAGKSTLLRILTGSEEADEGSFAYAPSVEVGYLPQTTPPFYGRSIQDLILEAVGNLRQLEARMHELEEVMSTAIQEQLTSLLEEYALVSTRFQDSGGYEIDYKIESILEGLRLSYLPRTQEVETLSGGEKARVGLATLLLRSPDIILLDEPTNHLDFASMEWLENYLSSYHGAALIVSHDRQFLNRAVNAIFEIDDNSHHLKAYTGNYDAYVAAREVERKQWEEDYLRQQEEIKELRKRIKEKGRHIGHSNRAPRDNDKFAKHFFGQRVDSAVARDIHETEERLKRIEADPIPKPPELLSVTSYFRTESIQSQIVVQMSDVRKGFGERQVFEHVHLNLAPQSRIMLTGPNGAGKTTLLRLLLGEEQPDGGTISLAPGARVGYLPQDPALPDLEKTVIETYRYGQIGYEGEFMGRLIGYGLFRLEDMQKRVRQLSIGQRRKLEIASLMARNPNVLLLDEPTNYISLDVLEAFEQAVLHFPGPVIAISHDRWFIQRFGGEVWELQEGQLVKKEDHEIVTSA